LAKEPSEPLRTFLINRYGNSIYNQLCDSGANLSYLWSLDVWLQVADASASILEQPTGPSARAKRWRQKKALIDAISGRGQALLQSYFQGFLTQAKQSDPSDPLLNPYHPQFHSRISEIYLKVMPRILDAVLNSIKCELRKEGSSRPTLRRAAMDGGCSENEELLANVFKEYSPTAAKYSKGGTQDLRGTFFLLSVTEHLGCHRGRYKLADRLLRTIRGQGKGPMRRRPRAELARKRVLLLMKTHPTWRSHVELMKQHWLALQ
jgi:hypothetical protein